MRDVVEAELLPAADGRVTGAVNERGYRPPAARVRRTGQHDLRQDLDPGTVRLDLDGGQQLVDHPRPADVVAEVDVRPARAGDRHLLTPLARSRLVSHPAMRQELDLGVPAGRSPTGLRPLETLVPRRLSARRPCGDGQRRKHRGRADQPSRETWHKHNTVGPGQLERNVCL